MARKDSWRSSPLPDGRECTACKTFKPLSEFRRKKGGRYDKESRCRACDKARSTLWRERIRETNYERYGLLVQKWALKYKYRLTPEQYDHMWETQGGRCAICNGVCSKALAVDHCHTSGKVRGLLCQKCNRGLGFFNDSVSLLNNAIKYLNKD